MNTLKNLLPTIIPLLLAIAYAVSTPVANYVGAHPTVAVVLGAVAAVLNHWLPSPVSSK